MKSVCEDVMGSLGGSVLIALGNFATKIIKWEINEM